MLTQITAIIRPHRVGAVLSAIRRSPVEALTVTETGESRKCVRRGPGGDSLAFGTVPKAELVIWIESSASSPVVAKILAVAADAGTNAGDSDVRIRISAAARVR